MPTYRLLVIVPAYNEETNIREVVASISRAEISSGVVKDVLVVNDGSTDRTGIVARAEGAMVLDLPFNLGIGGAVQSGFRYAVDFGYDMAMQIDGDGQHDPSYIQRLLDPIISNEADVVIGSRFLEKSADGFRSTVMRRMGIRVFAFVNSTAIGQRITDNTSGFRAYNRRVLEYLKDHYPTDYPEPEAVVLLGKKKFRIREVPVRMRERTGGASSITPLRSIYYMIKVLLAIFIDLMKRTDHA